VEQPSQSDKGVCSKLCTRKDNYYKSKSLHMSSYGQWSMK